MDKRLRPTLPTWPALAAGLAFGIVEWLALSRSRAIDRLTTWRLAVNRR